MKLRARGKSTLGVEVQNVSAFGVWLLVGDKELYASYADFPWFKNATIGQVLDVTQPHPGHLYWPQLDVDLATGSLDFPEKYPLVAKQTKGAKVSQKKKKYKRDYQAGQYHRRTASGCSTREQSRTRSYIGVTNVITQELGKWR